MKSRRTGFIWWSGRKLPRGSHQLDAWAAKRSTSCRSTVSPNSVMPSGFAVLEGSAMLGDFATIGALPCPAYHAGLPRPGALRDRVAVCPAIGYGGAAPING